jgi:hypothetical protein
MSLTFERRLERPLSLRRDTRQMPPLPVLPIHQGRVLRHTIIPNDHRPLFPLDTGLEVGAEGQVVVEELENGVGLFLFQTYDVAGDFCFVMTWARLVISTLTPGGGLGDWRGKGGTNTAD